jgi:hypothetical protein
VKDFGQLLDVPDQQCQPKHSTAKAKMSLVPKLLSKELSLNLYL